MKEITGQLTPWKLAGIVLPAVFCAFVLLSLLKLSEAAKILPVPRISFDPQLTLLLHQSHASRSHDPAKIILLGDSTCLLGVDARDLSRQLPGKRRVLSLSLLIWLDLKAYGEAADDFCAANPGQVRAMILLVSPAKLASVVANDDAIWDRIREAGRPGEFPQPGSLAEMTGVKLLRENIFSHLLDTPLEDKSAAMVFSSQLENYLTAHQGSLVEGGTFLKLKRGETNRWELAPEFEKQTRAFRSRIPSDVRLFIGLTPRPKGYQNPDDTEKRDDLLRLWNKWMNADGVLTNLPAVLPNYCFSKSGHLNDLGQTKFTAILAKNLTAVLADTSESRLAPR